MHRRSFFRQSLRQLLGPVVESLDKKFQQIEREFEKHMKPTFLRPPGALPEKDFLETCSRCRACVDACPAQCIRIDANEAGGAPYIDPSLMPCVVCTGLECMTRCPSGALVMTRPFEIDMGTARWTSSHCLRTNGDDCTKCVDECPIGEVAIVVVGRAIKVIDQGCIGCGVCQYQCPSTPKAIRVEPRAH